MALTGRNSFFEPQAITRHQQAREEINRRNKNIAFDKELTPLRITQRQTQRPCQVVHRNNRHQRRIHECRQQAIYECRNHRHQSLRQNHINIYLPRLQAQGISSTVLTFRNRLQTTANRFGHVSSLEKNDPDHDSPKRINIPTGSEVCIAIS